MVFDMPDEYADQSGNTQAFRAFVQTPEAAPQSSSKLPMFIGIAVVAVVVIALLAWFALS